jgi:hypothetical protein
MSDHSDLIERTENYLLLLLNRATSGERERVTVDLARKYVTDESDSAAAWRRLTDRIERALWSRISSKSGIEADTGNQQHMETSMNANPHQVALTRVPTLPLEDDHIIIGMFVQYVDNAGGWRRHEPKTPLPKGREYLGLRTRRALQRFEDGKPEIIATEVLPDPDELNEALRPWPIGLSGKEEPPWKREFIVYFLDVHGLRVLTYANATFGAQKAVHDLEDSWSWARMLYEDDVLPLFTLGEVEFKTQFGTRKRPSFDIIGWRCFRDGGLQAVEENALAALQAPAPKSIGEVMNDEIKY